MTEFIVIIKYYKGAQIKENEMGWICGTYVTEMQTGFWYENLKQKRPLENLGVDEIKNLTPT